MLRPEWQLEGNTIPSHLPSLPVADVVWPSIIQGACRKYASFNSLFAYKVNELATSLSSYQKRRIGRHNPANPSFGRTLTIDNRPWPWCYTKRRIGGRGPAVNPSIDKTVTKILKTFLRHTPPTPLLMFLTQYNTMFTLFQALSMLFTSASVMLCNPWQRDYYRIL